jgi:hypothetical protein
MDFRELSFRRAVDQDSTAWSQIAGSTLIISLLMRARRCPPKGMPMALRREELR